MRIYLESPKTYSMMYSVYFRTGLWFKASAVQKGKNGWEVIKAFGLKNSTQAVRELLTEAYDDVVSQVKIALGLKTRPVVTGLYSDGFMVWNQTVNRKKQVHTSLRPELCDTHYLYVRTEVIAQ